MRRPFRRRRSIVRPRSSDERVKLVLETNNATIERRD
jgi:hypothetical protein